MERSLTEIARCTDCEVIGNGEVRVAGVASIPSATSRDLVFVEDEKRLADALASRAAAVITSTCGDRDLVKPILLARQPRLAFALAAKLLFDSPHDRQSGIHKTAVIHESAKLGKGVTIEPHVVIEEGVRVGDDTRIGAGSVIGESTTVGEHCNFAPNVTIYPGVVVGNHVIVHGGATLGSDGFGYVRDDSSGRYIKFPQIGRLEIEDDVEIGANSTVDRGALDLTRIGRGTKIDNLVHVGHNVQIGEHVVIAAQTGLSGSAVVEDAVIIGGQVGIADHVRIESGAILGAQSGIPTKKIIRGKGVIFWGTPARPIREYLKELAVLAKLAKRGSQ
ncbi:MAG TPA: UDP-3-O-(3-hydroxymyristoyl)glucosamine N-acyltransferase [Terriglobales bacterium]|nr:UDP-3-O-(3-hydroxymyristoyl)glucosamine N-acyltransferase [Terriglobales bacterium]